MARRSHEEVNHSSPSTVPKLNAKYDLLVDWVCEILQSHIKTLLATRNRKTKQPIGVKKAMIECNDLRVPLDEVVEAIVLPEYNNMSNSSGEKTDDLNPTVTLQLRNYISLIASTYHDNPFHNFSHGEIELNIKYEKFAVTHTQ